MDALIGIWAVGRQLAAAVDTLVAETAPVGRVVPPPDVRFDDGDLLR